MSPHPINAARRPENVFIPISPTWHKLICVYVLLYLVILPILRYVGAESQPDLIWWRSAAEAMSAVLLFAPVLFFRSRIGWVHPLALIPLFGAAKQFVKDPSSLASPFRLAAALGSGVSNPLLPGYPENELAVAELRLIMFTVFGLLCYYTGYLATSRNAVIRLPSLPQGRIDPRVVRLTASVVVLSALAPVAYYLYVTGGVAEHLLNYWAGGRGSASAELRGRVGIVSVALDTGMIAMLLWYSLDRTVATRVIYIGAFALLAALSFLITGSRSGMAIYAQQLVLLYMLYERKLPKVRIVLMAVVVLLLLGRLGEFRRSITYGGQIDWNLLTRTDINSDIDVALAEIDGRESMQGGLPVALRVPMEVDYLYGKSYIGNLFFWIPRSFWPDKPRGGGYYNTQLLLGGGQYAIPIPPVAEAYWNFGIAGLSILFLLYGCFHRALANSFARGGQLSSTWLPYLVAILFITPGSGSFVFGVRGLVAVLAMMWVISRSSGSGQPAGYSGAQPVGFKQQIIRAKAR